MISKTVMTMKGNGNTRKGKQATEKGELWLKRKPFTYRRINSDWQRGIARDDWASNPIHPIDPVDDQPLENMKCPECNQNFPVESLRIKTGFHFSNLKCRKCHVVGSSKRWRCSCEITWAKCRLHVLPMSTKGSSTPQGSSRVKRKVNEVPTDHPLPAKRTRLLR